MGDYKVTVQFTEYGFANIGTAYRTLKVGESNDIQIASGLEVSYGGAELTISESTSKDTFFVGDKEKLNQVTVCDFPCKITSSTPSEIKC